MWEEDIIPHERKCGIMCPFHKEGNVTTRDNYTAVTLLCPTYKFPAYILYVQLVSYAEKIKGEYQGGFRRGRYLLKKLLL